MIGHGADLAGGGRKGSPVLAIVRAGVVFAWIPATEQARARRLADLLDAAILDGAEIPRTQAAPAPRRDWTPEPRGLPRGAKSLVVAHVRGRREGITLRELAALAAVDVDALRAAFWRGSFRGTLRVEWTRVARVWPR